MTGISFQPDRGVTENVEREFTRGTVEVARGTTRGTAAPDVILALSGGAGAVFDAVRAASRTAVAESQRTDTAVRDSGAVVGNPALDLVQTVLANIKESAAAVTAGSENDVAVVNEPPDLFAALKAHGSMTVKHTTATVAGKEGGVIDTAALADALANDPEALRAFLTGEKGRAVGVSVAPAADTEDVTPELVPPEAVASTADAGQREIADVVHSVNVTAQFSALQLFDSPSMAPRRRLDILV